MQPLASKSGGESPAGAGRPDNARFRSQFFKTQPCRFFALGRCRNTNGECPFAHSSEEINGSPDLTKTSICKKWSRGICPFSSKECSFAHGISDLRTTAAYADDDDASDDELNSDIVNHRPRRWARQQSEPWSQQQREPSKQTSWSRQVSGDSRSTIASEFSAGPLAWSRQISAPPKFDIASIPAPSKEALPVGPVRRPRQDFGGPGGMEIMVPVNKLDGVSPIDAEDLNKHFIASHTILPNYFQGCATASPVSRFDGVQDRQDPHYASPVTDKRFGADVGKVTPQMKFAVDLLKGGAFAISHADIVAMLDSAAAAVDQYED